MSWMCSDVEMIQSIVSDSSEGEDLSRPYRSFFPSSEFQPIRIQQTPSGVDVEDKMIFSVASSSSLSIEDEEVDTVVMNATDEGNDCAEKSICVDSNAKDKDGMEQKDASSMVSHSVGSPLQMEGAADNLNGETFQTDLSEDVSDTIPTNHAEQGAHGVDVLHSEESLLSEESSSPEPPPIISVEDSRLSSQHNSQKHSTTDLFTVEESPPETCEVVSDSSSSESIDLNTTCTSGRIFTI